MLTQLLAVLSFLATPLPLHRDNPRTLRDSVDVLLFSIPPVESVRVSGAGLLRLDGHRLGMGSVEVGLMGDRGLVAGTHRGVEFFASSSGVRPLGLRRGDRRRTVRGTVRITTAGRHLAIVARVTLRDYLTGTLAEESAERDPKEYRVALGFLQRNYVARHPGRHAPLADVCDNTHCQLFRSTVQSPRTREAVQRAQRLVWSTATLPCYYSSCCGGGTLTSMDVWGEPAPGAVRVACDQCSSSRWFQWRSSIASSPAVDAQMDRLPAAPFVDENAKIQMGRSLGWRVVPSNTIDRVERRGNRWHLAGRGFGHRVGLCQEGARRLALRGWSAERILRKYFPGES